jgi:Glycerate kinase family
MDAQTLSGKALSGVARMAATAGVPVVPVAGQCALGRMRLPNWGHAASMPGPNLSRTFGGLWPTPDSCWSSQRRTSHENGCRPSQAVPGAGGPVGVRLRAWLTPLIGASRAAELAAAAARPPGRQPDAAAAAGLTIPRLRDYRAA